MLPCNVTLTLEAFRAVKDHSVIIFADHTAKYNTSAIPVNTSISEPCNIYMQYISTMVKDFPLVCYYNYTYLSIEGLTRIQ